MRWLRCTVYLIACLRLPSPAIAQSLADRVAQAPDGRVLMSFTAKPGVCGHGRNISTQWRSDEWEPWCEPGPVRVVLRVEGRRVMSLTTHLGGRWRASAEGTDLGEVPAAMAAEYFLTLVERETGRVGKDAILAAVLADSAEVWPRLLAIARNESRPREVRKGAVFWLGQAAGEAAAEGLTQLATDSGDVDVREHAVFALSQLPRDQGVTHLIAIARTHADPRIRKKAIFWLGQSEDPRALALFEELLTRL